MAMKSSVMTMNGRIVSETRNGVRHFHAHDQLGNTIALYDDSGTKTDTYTYWPYGEVRTRTGSTVNPFQFCGAWGYYKDTVGRTYVRARTLRTDLTRWLSVDHFWPAQNPHGYCLASPTVLTDPSGTEPDFGDGINFSHCARIWMPSVPCATAIPPLAFLGPFCKLSLSGETCRATLDRTCCGNGDWATVCDTYRLTLSLGVSIRIKDVLKDILEIKNAFGGFDTLLSLVFRGVVGDPRPQERCVEKGWTFQARLCASGCGGIFSFSGCASLYPPAWPPRIGVSLGYCGIASLTLQLRGGARHCY